MRESEIEKRLREGVEAVGGMCLKFVSPGRRGVPDRLVLLEGGSHIFVELKAPGEMPEPHQARFHVALQDLDHKVFVISTTQEVDAFIVILRAGVLDRCFGCVYLDGAGDD